MPTKTYVSSSVISLNGDYNPETPFIKSTLISAVLDKNSNRTFLGEALTTSYLNGPGIRSRQYYSWSENNFPIGKTSGSIISYDNIDASVVSDNISKLINETINVSNVFIKPSDFIYYAEEYVSINHQDQFLTNWTADIIDGVVTVNFVDGSSDTFSIPDFDINSNIIVGYYTVIKDDYSDLVVEGNTYLDDPIDLSNYTLESDEDTLLEHTLTDRVIETISHSDATIDDLVNTTDNIRLVDVTLNHKKSIYEEYIGSDDVFNRVVTIKHTHNSWIRYNIITSTSTDVVTKYFLTDMDGNDVEVTSTDSYTYSTVTTTETHTQAINYFSEYRDDTQNFYSGELNGGYKVFIYKIGGSNVSLNNLVTSSRSINNFYPFIPLRVDNDSIRNTSKYSPDTYENIKKAFKRATGSSNIDDVIDDIESNEDIDDIDYAYQVSGISLNTDNNSAKEYLYRMFDNLFGQQNTTQSNFVTQRASLEQTSILNLTLYHWQAAQSDPNNPLFGTEPPDNSQTITRFNSNSISIKSVNNNKTKFDFRISWDNIEKESINGLVKPTAKVGDVYIEKGDSFLYYSGKSLERDGVDIIHAYKQVTENTFTHFTLIGLEHQNFIYEDKSVDITAHEALDDPDISGFIFPLDNDIVKSMSIVDSTEMMASANFLVFNSYERVKKKWYQSGIFSIIAIIVIIAIAVTTGYIDPATVGGLLGSSAGVGATLGLTGLSGLIVGIGLNAVATSLLIKLIGEVATEVFGEKIGLIITLIASVVIIGDFDTSSFGSSLTNWGQMASADSLLQLTSVIGNVTKAWVEGDTASVLRELDELQKEGQEKQDELDELIKELNGSSGIFDPVSLTDNGFNSQFSNESIDVFLQRTLMTGNDIVELSLSMINDFSELTLTLPES